LELEQFKDFYFESQPDIFLDGYFDFGVANF